jgi:hypothetical protein
MASTDIAPLEIADPDFQSAKPEIVNSIKPRDISDGIIKLD